MLLHDHIIMVGCMCRLIDIVGDLNKSYLVWQEIFDNGAKVCSLQNIIETVIGFATYIMNTCCY